MIRINLVPDRRKKRSSAVTVQAAGPGQVVLVFMLVGWVAVGGGLYWLLLQEQAATDALRAETAKINAEVEKIRKEIDEEGLQARKDKVEQLRVAIDKLKGQQRTPVYVMHELANILTTGKMPDIDEAELKRIQATDPQSVPSPNWDATSVWVSKVKESGGSLVLEGGARDAADLAEFTRRLRASSRFAAVSNADYTRVDEKTANSSTLKWTLTLQVKRWD
jgi:Tfp pilus assembly protein PilN